MLCFSGLARKSSDQGSAAKSKCIHLVTKNILLMTHSKAFRSFYFFISLGITGDQSNLRSESGNSNSLVRQDFHRAGINFINKLREQVHHNDVIVPDQLQKTV